MIPITGIGAVSALGDNALALFEGVCEGRSAIAPCHAWPGAPPVASIPGGPHLGSELAVRAVEEALGDQPRQGVGVVGASTAGDMVPGELAHQAVMGGGPPSPAFVWAQLADRPTAEVARRCTLGGPRLTLSSACTSGAMAIGVAASWIATGRAEAVVAFGTDALCRTTVHGFRALGVTAPDPCRPFGMDRAGMSLGEGAGALLLEHPDRARARGTEPIAWLAGYGSAGDALYMTAPDPAGSGARRAVRQALGAWAPSSVGYINAHGTGTELNDAMEAALLAELFPGVPASSTKGATGHTLGAAGAVEAVLTVLAIAEGIPLPNVGVRRPLPGIRLVERAAPASILRALTVNFAFGGSCTALALAAAPP